MFGNMLFQTYLVAAGAKNLNEVIKLFWAFKVPWGWNYTVGTMGSWIAQFSFGFYTLMLTSTLIGLGRTIEECSLSYLGLPFLFQQENS